jgi:hypothetical protein
VKSFFVIVALIIGGAALASAQRPAVLPLDDHAGFEAIFDGSSLKGWDGDPAFWRVEDGAIVGESTIARPLRQNTFLIWRGGEPKDFELKCEYRLTATNSGIQIRSVQLPAGGDIGKWVMKGYQADIDYKNQFTGQVYEERGRRSWPCAGNTLRHARRNLVVLARSTGPGDLKGIFNINGWNQVHLIARGNTITEIVNGSVTSVLIDHDTKGAPKGLMGFQMHVGAPMKVEFRNIWLKQY